jgi:hypothetical protein
VGKTEPKRYLELAAQKRALAANTTDPILRKSYSDLADAYEKLSATIQRIELLMERPKPRRT